MGSDSSKHKCSPQQHFQSSHGQCCGHDHSHHDDRVSGGDEEMSFDSLPQSGEPKFTGKPKARKTRQPQ